MEIIIKSPSMKFHREKLWRKDVFPHYKASRKTNRDKQVDNFDRVYALMDYIKEELLEYTDYLVIENEKAEGDDIVATLAIQFNIMPNVIISKDHDFTQLLDYTDVKIFNPATKTFIQELNPKEFLKSHIITGDRGDGIPNVLSDDDCFVADKKQKTLSKQKIQDLLTLSVDDWLESEYKDNWVRNHTVVDLRNTPKYIQDEIIALYQQQLPRNGKKLFNYFQKYGLTNLMESMRDF